METILATVTVISLALAACMGVLLARIVREERRRSDARAALLAELAEDHDRGVVPTYPGPRAARAITDARPATIASREAVLSELEDLDFREADQATTPMSGSLFAEGKAPSAWPFRLVAATVVVVVIAGVAFGVRVLSDREALETEQVVTLETPRPLQLLSLAHRPQDGQLAISGVVQNPRDAVPVSRVEATVLAFDASGDQIASGRAPLDFTTLAPGHESPFIVRITAKNVARYRISFRGEGGQPLAHVDRRDLDSVARKELP